MNHEVLTVLACVLRYACVCVARENQAKHILSFNVQFHHKNSMGRSPLGANSVKMADNDEEESISSSFDLGSTAVIDRKDECLQLHHFRKQLF